MAAFQGGYGGVEETLSCEHDFHLLTPEEPDSTHDTVGVAGVITNIVEFHDCQRLLEGASDLYGTLAGVYASARLDSLVEDLGRLAPGTAIAAAEVVAFDGGYGPLFVRRYFNCLYVRREAPPSPTRPARWRAWMVPVGSDGDACRQPQRPGDHWNELRMEPAPGAFAGADIPPVVRWEWSPRGQTQSIGLKCGDDWCIAANRNGYSHSPQHRAGDWPPNHPRVDLPPPATGARGRVLEVRGWYDEQRLAPPRGVATRAAPILATIFPDPRLAQYDSAAFRQTLYLPAAYVVMPRGASPFHREYQAKANFRAGWNTVYLCMGDTSRCLPPGVTLNCPTLPSGSNHYRWTAKVVSQGDSTRYFCVTRREYPGSVNALAIMGPGTARFRWKAVDETTWMSCLNGCCEVEQ